MKRYIKSNLLSGGTDVRDNEVHSGFSFDFIWKDDDYDMGEIQGAVYDVFESEFNLEVDGIDFVAPNYEDVKEFHGENISQVCVDFIWTGDNYSEEEIADSIDEAMMSLGYVVVGYDFFTV